MQPLELSQELYNRLRYLIEQNITDINQYTDIIREYINQHERYTRGEYLYITWELDGQQYDMYNSFSNAYDYIRFIEDCSMAVYRLNGGEGYNTYQLAEKLGGEKW